MSLHSIEREIKFNRFSLVWISTLDTCPNPAQNVHDSYYQPSCTEHHPCMNLLFKDVKKYNETVYFCECGICRSDVIKHYFLSSNSHYICPSCRDDNCPTPSIGVQNVRRD